MSRKYFTFYRLYHELSLDLSEKQFLLFMKNLMRVHFDDGITFENAKKVRFEDLILASKWEQVIIQLSKRDRNTTEYTKWRRDVYERDLYTCKQCGDCKCKLNAHHIVRWVDSIELRYELSNGITLCVECHKAVHKGDIIL